MEKFEILNGRRSFYQWDYDQKLAVLDDTVTQVHFPLGTESCPPLPVYEDNGQRVVDVPDILLQTAGVKRVYAFVEDAFGGRTICTETFRVNERAKPDDYIYTEQELWTAEKAVQKALQEAKDSGDFTGPPGPKGEPGVVKFKVVNELPEQDTENAIYLVPGTDGAEDNLFDEYIFIDGAWEKIGSAAVAVDMSGYVKDTDLVKPYEKAGLVNVNPSAYGIGAYPSNGYLYINPAPNADIDAKTNARLPIVPNNLDYAVKKGLADSKEEWTEDEKKAARDLVGAVGTADYAVNAGQAGIVHINQAYGIRISSDHTIRTMPALEDEINKKTNTYKIIAPSNLDYAVKVALTTNSIALTDEEKAAVRAWLGIE